MGKQKAKTDTETPAFNFGDALAGFAARWKFPSDWETSTISKEVRFTRRSDTPNRSNDGQIPFIPMDLLPDSTMHTASFEMRSSDELTSGVAFNEGDLLLAKITPCLENGKQGIARGIPGGWGMATTEVFPFRPKRLVTEFLAFYLKDRDVRLTLAGMMQGATGRQRLPREAFERLPVPVPPLAEQRAIAHVLRAVQQAKEATEKVIAAVRQLKQSLMRHLFTYGAVPVDKAEQVVLKETECGLVPEHWAMGKFDEFAVLQRGFDITKEEQRPGKIPVVSSSGIKSYHDNACVKGPGVVIGRKGSLGTAHFIESDYWPHDTTLWVKDFRGNFPRFLYYFFFTLKLEKLDTGTSNPTLNRNYVHALKVGMPAIPEQQLIAEALQRVDDKIVVEQKKNQTLDALFRSLLHHLMTGKVRVNGLGFPGMKEGRR